MSDKITQEELDLIAKFLENNEAKELEEGYAEDALELDKRIFIEDERFHVDNADISTAWAAYKDRKGV